MPTAPAGTTSEYVQFLGAVCHAGSARRRHCRLRKAMKQHGEATLVSEQQCTRRRTASDSAAGFRLLRMRRTNVGRAKTDQPIERVHYVCLSRFVLDYNQRMFTDRVPRGFASLRSRRAVGEYVCECMYTVCAWKIALASSFVQRLKVEEAILLEFSGLRVAYQLRLSCIRYRSSSASSV